MLYIQAFYTHRFCPMSMGVFDCKHMMTVAIRLRTHRFETQLKHELHTAAYMLTHTHTHIRICIYMYIYRHTHRMGTCTVTVRTNCLASEPGSPSKLLCCYASSRRDQAYGLQLFQICLFSGQVPLAFASMLRQCVSRFNRLRPYQLSDDHFVVSVARTAVNHKAPAHTQIHVQTHTITHTHNHTHTITNTHTHNQSHTHTITHTHNHTHTHNQTQSHTHTITHTHTETDRQRQTDRQTETDRQTDTQI